jgi:hypothetical protein
MIGARNVEHIQLVYTQFTKVNSGRIILSGGPRFADPCTNIISTDEFYVRVTVLHRNKFLFNKTNQIHQFHKFILS